MTRSWRSHRIRSIPEDSEEEPYTLSAMREVAIGDIGTSIGVREGETIHLEEAESDKEEDYENGNGEGEDEDEI